MSRPARGKKKAKGKAPAHQNTFAYHHNKGSKKTKAILSLPNEGLCTRCHEQIEWRKKYRKYKPLKQPAVCAHCKERTVKHAYHVICQSCAEKEKACAKCLASEVEIETPFGQKELEEEEKRRLDEGIKEMTERERRKFFRDLEKGSKSEKAWESGEEMDDEDDFDDDDSYEDSDNDSGSGYKEEGEE